MQLFASTKIKQRQGLAITVQLQQAIKLLHYNNVELASYLEEQAQENPFIELAPAKDEKPTIDSLSPSRADKRDEKVTIDNQFETGDSFSSGNSKASKNFDDDIGFGDTLKSTGPSLYEHVCQFAHSNFTDDLELRVALALCEELEPSGWLTVDLENIQKRISVSDETVEHVLRTMQTIEPSGLFARNLRECLILQLEDQSLLEDDIVNIVANLDLLAKGNLEGLKRKFNIRDKRMKAILTTIRSLDPKPGTQFYFDDRPITSPDLKIINKDDTWAVSLYSSNLPTIVVKKEFAQQAIQNSLKTESKDFLKTYLSDAHWLKRAIQQRNETTLKIGMSILKHQLSFFERGPAYLQPLTLKTISEDVGVHESTVSRVTSNSLVETPFGVLPLKFFFSSKISSKDETKSGASIRHQITNMIKAENPTSPLSDEEIVEKFNSMGTKIARRTVAKYRKMDGIPSSFDRRKQAKLQGILQ